MSQNRERNYCGIWMRIVFCLFALSGCSSVLVAQQTPDTPPPSTDSQDTTPVVLVMPSASQNIALLGTDQRFMDLGTLQTRRRAFFLYGTGISESYIDNFEAVPGGQASSEFLLSPHIAFIDASNHSSFSIQYAPAVVQTTSGPSNSQVFQSGSISFGQPLTRNWMLQLNSSDNYGSDTSRLLSPPGFTVNGGVPVSDPSGAVFQFNRGNVFSTEDTAGLTWQRTVSQSMNFSAQESYVSLLDGGPSSSSTFAQASYTAAVTSRTSVNVGGNYNHQQFSVGSCDGYGFSFGISHEFGRNVSLGISAGPEFESAPCNKGLSGNYNLSIAYPLSRRSRVGLMAGRSYTSNYLTNTQYSDTGAVSYSRQLGEAFQISLNSGYTRSVFEQSTLGAYVGYFAGADFSWKLSRTISLGTTYRHFEQVSGGPIQGQNMGIVTLGWNPLPVRIV
jgi:hypothetical protein